MTRSVADQAREDRIESITQTILEAAMVEALALAVGPMFIREALMRASSTIEKIITLRHDGKFGAQRMNELREWIGMTTVPDAAATAKRVNGHG